MDLEGIVCKRKDSPYKVTEKPSGGSIGVICGFLGYASLRLMEVQSRRHATLERA